MRIARSAAPLAVAMLAAFAVAAPPEGGPPKSFRQILADRPAPRLDDLAERAAPDRDGEAATESFWDLLKLRDAPDPAAAAPLAKILESHGESRRIHRFAAAQALMTLGTDRALRAMERDVLRPDYPVELALQYVSGWEMPEPARSRFVGQYLLRSAGDGRLGVKVEPAWRDGEGGRVLAVAVTLTNKSDRPLALMIDPHQVARRLQLQAPDGRFVAAAMQLPCVPLPPKWVRLPPGASERFDAALQLTDAPEARRRFRDNPPAAVLTAGGGGAEFGLVAFGRYHLYATVAQLPVTPAQLETQQAWAKDVGDPAELWTGRAVSEPAAVEIADPAPRGKD